VKRILLIVILLAFQADCYAQFGGFGGGSEGGSSESSESDAGSESEDRVDTSEVVQNSFTEPCTKWCVTGVCFWLICTPFGCEVETNLRVRHGYASLVVSVYNVAGEPTWEDAPILNSDGSSESSIPIEVAGGLDAESFSPMVKRLDTNLKFKEVGVHGNPLPTILSQVDYFCPSGTTMFMPYYSSETDSQAWRSGIPERFYPWIYVPGLYEIGDWPKHTWSPLYPRYGFINQRDDAHAAGVAAVRGVDIASEGYLSPHLHIEIAEEEEIDSSVAAFRYPKENPWQRISPNPSTECEVMGDDNSREWSGDVSSTKGFNAWNYWHIYECCVPNSGALIGYVSSGSCSGEDGSDSSGDSGGGSGGDDSGGGVGSGF